MSEKFKVSFHGFDEPNFNIRCVIPTELKDLWVSGKALYNASNQWDPLWIKDLFIDKDYLFIDTDGARKSHLFKDGNEVIFDENYKGVPDELFLQDPDEDEFMDDCNFFSCNNEYFDSPQKLDNDIIEKVGLDSNLGGWRLDWYGLDQDEFDEKYYSYFGEYPEDSFYEPWDDDDEDEDYDEDEYEESFSAPFKKTFKEKMSNRFKFSEEVKRMLKN